MHGASGLEQAAQPLIVGIGLFIVLSIDREIPVQVDIELIGSPDIFESIGVQGVDKKYIEVPVQQPGEIFLQHKLLYCRAGCCFRTMNPRLDDDQPIVTPPEKTIIDGQVLVGGAGDGKASAKIIGRSDLTAAIFAKALS